MIGLISLENQSLPLMVSFFTLGCARGFNKGEQNQFRSAASIILIIGAGGAFKNVWQGLVNEAIASLATSFDIVALARYSHD
jgi:H+/gluconate symporter-like permease